jgi:hypothetical protein
MTAAKPYNTNLSKAQGIVPETLELLDIWSPGMSPLALKNRVREVGALGKATQTRVDDVVGRGFAQRFLTEGDRPALYLKAIAAAGPLRGPLRQLMLIYAARSQAVLHDFIVEVYWSKANSHSQEVTKQDARDFLERAKAARKTETDWSPTMTEKVTRYLLGTLEDFDLIVENRFGHRQLRPPAILPETALYLTYDLHFHAVESQSIPRHPDWRLFGLMPADVIALLEKLAAQGHLQLQNAGGLLRLEWTYSDMESVIHALTH